MNITKAWTASLDDYVIDLAWSPDGRRLAAASAAGPMALLDGDSGVRQHELAGHADGTNAIAFAPASVGTTPLLASGGQDGCVRLWNADTGEPSTEIGVGPGAWVENLAWRPDAGDAAAGRPSLLAAAAGRKLLLLGPDGVVRHTFPDAPKTISAVAWHPQGGCIAAAWYGGVCLWDTDDFHAQREYAYGSAIPTLIWSPDGRWLIAGAQDKAVHLWIPEENEEFHMSGYETKVRELSFSSDSRWLATGGARDACVWDCTGAGPEGREPLALPHNERVCAVAFQHTHDLLATAANDHEVNLWIPVRRQPLVATARLTAPASGLAWSPDDSRLAVGSQQGGMLVLRVAQ